MNNLAADGGFLGQSPRREQTGHGEQVHGPGGIAADRESRLSDRHLRAHARGKIDRIDVGEKRRGIGDSALGVGEDAIDKAFVDGRRRIERRSAFAGSRESPPLRT